MASSKDRLEFLLGMRASVPIALAYFAVSCAVGLYWAQVGFAPLTSAIFSATSFSSTGEFAGIKMMAERGGLFELALTTVLINLRYMLMSASISQRLPVKAGLKARFAIAMGVTDEIYAINISRPHLSVSHYLGATILPLSFWVAGTLVGAFAGEIIPSSVQVAAGILLYAMFVAIIIPPIMNSAKVAIVVVIAGICAIALAYLPFTTSLAFGWRVIITTLFAAGCGATFFPQKTQDKVVKPREQNTLPQGMEQKPQKKMHNTQNSADLPNVSDKYEPVPEEK